MEKTSFLKEPVGGQSVVNKIVDNITNAIINGELNPGDKIPTEAELSESMGAGRNSVREAIKVLEAYGVVHKMCIRDRQNTQSRTAALGIPYSVLYFGGIITGISIAILAVTNIVYALKHPEAVSYTHLDVYKRQTWTRRRHQAL